MKEELVPRIQIKISISLNKLLATSKQFHLEIDKDDKIAKSYNQIALNADLRKATISDSFNSNSVPNTTTLILIIEAMGHTLKDFALIYESITESDIIKFKSELKK